MTKFILSAITAFYGISAFAATSDRCKAEVEAALPELAEDGGATAEDKNFLIQQIQNDETHLNQAEATELIGLLRARGTLAFSFVNDAGAWITVVDASTCKIILNRKALDI